MDGARGDVEKAVFVTFREEFTSVLVVCNALRRLACNTRPEPRQVATSNEEASAHFLAFCVAFQTLLPYHHTHPYRVSRLNVLPVC